MKKGVFEGIKVAEFAAIAAGPLIGKFMADHGATVVHVESYARPDGFRSNYPPYKDNKPGLDRSGSFAICNNNKLGITINLKAPGAIDVGAPEMFFDPELPAAEFVGVLAAFLDIMAAAQVEGATFATLDVDQRVLALDQSVQSLDLTELAIQLAKLAYFASEQAGCHLGYPGANVGWVDHPDFTFGEPMADEITEDGNYP